MAKADTSRLGAKVTKDYAAVIDRRPLPSQEKAAPQGVHKRGLTEAPASAAAPQ
jgi:hypothetical protein